MDSVKSKVPEILKLLGFSGIQESEIEEFTACAVNATFGIRDIVIKINSLDYGQNFLPNKLVSDYFCANPLDNVKGHIPVARVLKCQRADSL